MQNLKQEWTFIIKLRGKNTLMISLLMTSFPNCKDMLSFGRSKTMETFEFSRYEIDGFMILDKRSEGKSSLIIRFIKVEQSLIYTQLLYAPYLPNPRQISHECIAVLKFRIINWMCYPFQFQNFELYNILISMETNSFHDLMNILKSWFLAQDYVCRVLKNELEGIGSIAQNKGAVWLINL